MTPGLILLDILDDLNLLTEEQARRAQLEIKQLPKLGIACTGVEIDGRHYIISVEDVSS